MFILIYSFKGLMIAFIEVVHITNNKNGENTHDITIQPNYRSN